MSIATKTSSKAIPHKMSLLLKKPILKVEYFSLRHANMFAICIITIPAKAIVTALRCRGFVLYLSFG